MPPVTRWAVIRSHPRGRTVVTAESPPIPRAAGSLPFLGHMIPLIRDNLGFIASLRRDYGPLVQITLQPGTRTVIVQDPDLIQAMLKDLSPHLDKGRFFEKMGQLLGDSVVTAAGRVHRDKRHQLQPAFARDEIARYVDKMRDEVTAAVDTWKPGQAFDVREAMVKLSLDMLAKTVLSDSLDDSAFRRVREDLSVVMAGVGARVMMPDWVEKMPLPANRRFNRARDAVRATIEDAVDKLQVERSAGGDNGADDMLSMLLRANMTRHQICSEILTLAVAGTETTASVLSWTLYELTRHPDIETRVLAELNQVLADRPVTFEDVVRIKGEARLPYLHRVLDEVLRLHHTGLLVTRRTLTETRLGKWTLPAGTELAYCQHALHRDPNLFPDPLSFRPDRWLETEQPPPSGAYLPFGHGKHKCIGDFYARAELITAVATILRRRRFDLAPGPTVQPVGGATVRPGKMVMTVQARDAPART
ncbi:cytochrome P450 [Streptomyces massasporeus]|uniref:cytochrome P450 n=1 Tax=Streptomyces massasporeus TaxID=67324 RepID=UPI0033D12A34